MSNSPTANITSHNYVVNYGNTDFYRQYLPGNPFGGSPFNCYNGGGPCGDDGPVNAAQAATWTRLYGRPVPLAVVRDGTSSTLMMSETVQGKGLDARGFTWWGGATGFVTAFPPNTSSPNIMTGAWCNVPLSPPCITAWCNVPLSPPCITASSGTVARRSFARSLHVGGVQVNYCDGHGSFVSNSVSSRIWLAMGTARVGEPVSMEP